MKTLLKKDVNEAYEIDEDQEDYGPDPVLLRKKGLKQFALRDMQEFKSRINDEDYITHAIERIAVELMHHLVK